MTSTATEKYVDISVTSEAQPVVVSPDVPASNFKRGARFWLIFGALCCCTLLSALDLVGAKYSPRQMCSEIWIAQGGIGTAGPTIVHDLNGSDFTWVASAYALSASACIPLSGNLSQVFGRRLIILAGIMIFGIGSAVSGSAHSLVALIVGRSTFLILFCSKLQCL